MQDPSLFCGQLENARDKSAGPMETSAQILWGVKCSENFLPLELEMVERCASFGFDPEAPFLEGMSPEAYTVKVLARGANLLVGVDEVEAPYRLGLAKIRRDFIGATSAKLDQLDTLGYIIWALLYEFKQGRRIFLSNSISEADRKAAIFLEVLLSDDEIAEVRSLRGGRFG